MAQEDFSRLIEAFKMLKEWRDEHRRIEELTAIKTDAEAVFVGEARVH